MNMEAWRLTDKEIDEYMKKGIDAVIEAQKAKRQAFEDGGGVILNPQALEVLYEALKEADIVICQLCKRLNPQHAQTPGHDGCEWCQDRELRLKALSGAEEE